MHTQGLAAMFKLRTPWLRTGRSPNCANLQSFVERGFHGPLLDPLGFNSPNKAQRHALHVERTAEKAVMLSDRAELSSAEARVEEITGGSVGV